MFAKERERTAVKLYQMSGQDHGNNTSNSCSRITYSDDKASKNCISSPIPIDTIHDDTKYNICGVKPLALSTSCRSESSWSSCAVSTPTRPTKDEAMALLEIMAKPPSSNTSTPNTKAEDECSSSQNVTSVDRRRKSQRSLRRMQSLPSRTSAICHIQSSAVASPIMHINTTASSEASTASISFPFPKIKKGAPYESTLPHLTSKSSSVQSHTLQKVKKYSLLPRFQPKQKEASNHNAPQTQCLQHGLGPFLSVLPESIIYSIVSYVDYFDRHPTLMLVSHGMTSILTRPEFLLEMKHICVGRNHYSPRKSLISKVLDEDSSYCAPNELLLIVGGKFPTKVENNYHGREELPFINGALAAEGRRMHRRMTMQNNDQRGIMGYDPKRKCWMRFGGDPLELFNENNSFHGSTERRNNLIPKSGLLNNQLRPPHTTLHPLSPLGILDSRPIFIGYPHYCLMFFGGTHCDSGMPSNRVIAYSFLSARWETWPEMMRARHGDDFILARAEGQRNSNGKTAESPYSRNDQIVLIGCDLEFCDCFRCNPPSPCRKNPDIDMISFTDEEFRAVAKGEHKTKKENLDVMGRCEVLDLTTRKWERRRSRAPSCPPDDGGVAVLEGRYIFLPGTCPPPPSSASWQRKQESRSGDDGDAEIVTPLSQSETNSCAGALQSPSSSIEEPNEVNIGNDQSSTSSMDVESEVVDEDGIAMSPLGNLFRSLHYRPGLCYDAWFDRWSTLPPRPFVTTSSPTTHGFHNRVLVFGGYRSSSENALSCYHHREEDSILDYEDHLDYAWWYTPSSMLPRNDEGKTENDCLDANDEIDFNGSLQDRGEWTFGGGTTVFGHRQAWAHSSDMAAAVAAAAALKQSTNRIAQWEGDTSSNDDMNHRESVATADASSHVITADHFPCGAPVPVRGAAATTYQGRLTVLGGLSTFSRTFYDSERKTIWQFYPENREWRRAPMELPVPALLDGHAFSVHI